MPTATISRIMYKGIVNPNEVWPKASGLKDKIRQGPYICESSKRVNPHKYVKINASLVQL